MVKKREAKSWKLEYTILNRKHNELQEKYNKLLSQLSNNTPEKELPVGNSDEGAKKEGEEKLPISEPLNTSNKSEVPQHQEPEKNTSENSPSQVAVDTQSNGNNEVEQQGAEENLSETSESPVDLEIETEDEEEITNKCGQCGATVDSSMICSECGEDYN